ncbi:MAG: hypothetical protein RMJ98_22555, partial [Myxococcales bacterium]|nr:hypothetical protein [Polyangiaceae bacterium]MDW8252086.1 hypothetical protein [Myxococcales bacterium]
MIREAREFRRSSRGGKALGGVLAALFTAGATPSVAAEGVPLQMEWEKPTQCLTDGKGQGWRVQCDAETKVCIYAPDAELDAEGN